MAAAPAGPTDTLSGKRVLITAASAGIGRATAVAFAAAGAHIALVARGKERLQQLVSELPAGQAVAIPADLAQPEQAAHAVHQAVSELGGLDVVAHVGGLGSEGEPLSEEVWRGMYDTHVISSVVLAREAMPELIKTKGCVVFVSSALANLPLPGKGSYCAAKAALDMLTQTLALEYAPQGVRVNAVAPGAILTPGLENHAMKSALLAQGRALESVSDSEKAAATGSGLSAFGEKHPLGRVGGPEEVAAAIVFLASPRASFITGVILPVDGGLQLTNSMWHTTW